MANSKTTQANINDQMKSVFDAFFEYPKTMKEVDIETNIMRENICWYVKYFRIRTKIALVGYRKCKITGREVGIYSTNPDFFLKSNQLELFE